jgi:outer membrane protein assembly factor BamD
MKKYFVIATLVIAAIVAAGGANYAQAQKRKLTKEERRIERERKIAERATAATEVKVKAGKKPSYNKLLKSTSYDLMYTEALRYYNMKKKGKDYNTSANYQKAQNLLDAVYQSQRYNGTSRQDSLSYYLGSSFYKSGSFDVSEQIFDGFRRTFPNSVFIEDVEYMYAMGFYFSSPAPSYDQSKTLRAMIAISEYQGRYPNTVKKAECDERMLELRQKLFKKSYENARLYYTIGQYKAAVRAINNAIDEYPESPYREELMYLATKSAYLFAKNSVFSQQTDRYMSMMDNYFNLISEYPGTEHLKEVEKMRDEATTHIDKYTKEDTATTTIQQENGN